MANKDHMPLILDGVHYLPDFASIRWEPVDTVRQMVDQGIEPGEQSLSNQGLWKRTQDDFVLGAGQTWFDHPQESSRRRFRESFNIDPWNRRSVKLTRKTSQRLGKTNTNQKLIVAAGKLVLIHGGDATVISNPMADPWTDTAVASGAASPITTAATDGTDLYVGFGNAVASTWVLQNIATSPTWAVWDTVATDLMRFCNGRMIGSNQDEIFEFAADGTKRATIYTHFNTNFTWVDAVGAPNGIYIGGNNGTQGEIYICTVIDQTGDINAPYHAATLPPGETLRCMVNYRDLIILGTNRGVRVAAIGDAGFLETGPLILVGGNTRYTRLAEALDNAETGVDLDITSDVPDATIDSGELDLPTSGGYIMTGGEVMSVSSITAATATVTRGQLGTAATTHAIGDLVEVQVPSYGVTGLHVYGQYCWFTWRDNTNARTGLGRLDLGREVQGLVPPYAADVTAVYGLGPTQGQVDTPVTWVDSAGTGQEYRAFILQGGTSGSGVWMQTPFYNNYGLLRTGRITFGIAERKGFQSVEVTLKPLPSGASIDVTALRPDGTKKILGSIETAGTTNQRFDVGIEDEWIELEFRLNAATQNSVTAATPEMERWTLRAVPMPFRAYRIQMPVILYSQINDDGRGVAQDPWTEWSRLEALRTSRSQVTMQLGSYTATVVVDGLQMAGDDPRPVGITEWTRERDWVEAIWTVTLLTVDGAAA